jgi:hypothetical protein
MPEPHTHRINKDKFLAEMEKRGWKLDPVGWVVPEGRRIHQRESDWLASILLAIECECPHAQSPQDKVQDVPASIPADPSSQS